MRATAQVANGHVAMVHLVAVAAATAIGANQGNGNISFFAAQTRMRHRWAFECLIRVVDAVLCLKARTPQMPGQSPLVNPDVHMPSAPPSQPPQGGGPQAPQQEPTAATSQQNSPAQGPMDDAAAEEGQADDDDGIASGSHRTGTGSPDDVVQMMNFNDGHLIADNIRWNKQGRQLAVLPTAMVDFTKHSPTPDQLPPIRALTEEELTPTVTLKSRAMTPRSTKIFRH